MTRVFTPENPDGVATPPLEVSYRFRCYHCDFVQMIKSRDEIPEVCPHCERKHDVSRKKVRWAEREGEL